MTWDTLTLALQVQNDQCQPTVEESRWMRTTEKGWEFHSVSGGAGGDTGGSLGAALRVPCVPPRVPCIPPQGGDALWGCRGG